MSENKTLVVAAVIFTVGMGVAFIVAVSTVYVLNEIVVMGKGLANIALLP